MTDFTAATPPAVAAPAATSFQAAGTPAPVTDDTIVVLELDGRKLTRTEIATALKRLNDSQSHITKLEGEAQQNVRLLEAAAKKLEAAASAQAVLDKLNTPAPAAAVPVVVPPTADAVAAQVLSTLDAQKAQAQQAANWTEITTALTGAFGDHTNSKVAEKAKALGYTVEEMANLARTKPAAFKAHFPELSARPSAGASSFQSTVNTSAGGQPKPVSSGYATAKSQGERIRIVQDRVKAALAEAGA